MRDVSPLLHRVNVNRMTSVPQRYPRLIRLRVVELLNSTVEVDHLLQELAEATRLPFGGEGLRNRSSRLVDPRWREAERRRGEGEVGAGGSCVRNASMRTRKGKKGENSQIGTVLIFFIPSFPPSSTSQLLSVAGKAHVVAYALFRSASSAMN